MKMVLRLLRAKPSTHYLRVNYSSQKKTHYDALGLGVGATHNEIKSAYYKLSLQYHPDKDSSRGAKERFQEISSAYEVLGNHDSKKQYDLRMRTMQGPDPIRHERSFTSNESKNMYSPQTKIYDFDEWNYQHYGELLNRAVQRKNKYRNFMETKTEKRDNMSSGGVELFICAVVIITMIVHAIHLDVSQDKVKITDKSEDKSE